MGSIWIIAQHSVREAVRMRVVVAFAVLILAVVAGMPLAIYREDALISSMVQTFLAWTLLPIGLILSCLAIFLGCLSISDDMVQRQIFLLICKPLPRWKYVIGKWLGVVTVLSGLLLFAGLSIYAVARVMALQPNPDPVDPLTLRHQVLTARASARRYVPDVAAQAAQIFQRRVEEGRYSDPSKSEEVQERLEISKELLARERTVGPGDYRVLEFRDILLPPGARDVFDIVLVDVPREQRDQVIQVLAQDGGRHPTEAAGMLQELPQSVGLRMRREPAQQLAQRLVQVGAEVFVRPGYLLQLRYKAQGLGYLTDETLVTFWHFGPTPEEAAQRPPQRRKDRKERYHIVDFSAQAVGEDGRVFAVVRNMEQARGDRNPGHPGATVQFESASLEVLYVIGTFEGNLCRTLFLVWCRVTLIAGVAVLAATFLSFPVACLVAFLFYILAVGGTYVSSAMEFGQPGEGILGPLQYAVQPAMEAVFWVMPKFSEYDGVENFVDGRNVSLMWNILAFGKLIGLLTTAALLTACVVFQRRQVAELSV